VLSLVVLAPVAVFFVGCWLAGYRLQEVRTGSMDPTYPIGSLLVSEPIDASEVDTGMAVTFIDPADRSRLVTHRVVRIERDREGSVSFVTQGDANPDADAEPVPPDHVRSRVRWSVPHLGGVLARLRGPWAVALVLGVPVALALVGEVRDRRRGADGRTPDVAALDATCPSCGGGVASKDRYCRRCGLRLAELATSST
jgi:signal peptidase